MLTTERWNVPENVNIIKQLTNTAFFIHSIKKVTHMNHAQYKLEPR
jgi:hypothetical protein